MFHRSAVALLVLAAVAAPATAQEPALPPGVVAQVGAQPISLGEFEHWERLARRGAPVPVDPPAFERCVSAERRRARMRGHAPSPRALVLRCERRARVARRETMTFLVQALWVRQEAAARGITVSPERVQKELERQKRASFPNDRAFRRFLRGSGMRELDLLARVELDILQTRVTVQVTSAIRPVTSAEAKRYLTRHHRRYRGKTRRHALAEIRSRLKSQRRQRVLARFIDQFRSRHRAATVCADAYRVPECG